MDINRCSICCDSKSILTPIASSFNQEYLCLDCYTKKYGPVAQLDKAPSYGLGESGFDSLQVHHQRSKY